MLLDYLIFDIWIDYIGFKEDYKHACTFKILWNKVALQMYW